VMFEALADNGVNLQMITTSEIKISVLVDRASAVTALRTVHRAFLLDRQQIALPGPAASPGDRLEPKAMKLVPLAEDDTESASGQATVSTEQKTLGMEDLVIAGVELDESQARVALFHVPDQPGHAATVFRAIAEAGVFVDMIVQNVGAHGDSLLSFTVPRTAAERAVHAVRSAGIQEVSVEPALAKLSVIGVGMRTHTGVATRMFAALAERGININLINTSEVRINVGTDIAHGQEGLECLKRAFAL
jgi:aspartate kinase